MQTGPQCAAMIYFSNFPSRWTGETLPPSSKQGLELAHKDKDISRQKLVLSMMRLRDRLALNPATRGIAQEISLALRSEAASS